MRYVTCGSCRTENIPQNTVVGIDGVLYCESCVREKFPQKNDLNERQVTHTADPTICFNCGKDNGDLELGKLGTYPVCQVCDEAIAAKVFPSWVKLFFIAVLCVVLFSFVWNWRFMESAALLARMSRQEPVEADFELLAANVPEVEEFRWIASFYRGVRLLQEDNSTEALIAFQDCGNLPEDYHVDVLRLQANIGSAFDRRDYNAFLGYSKEFLQYDSSAMSYAMIASAYSCLYASSQLKEMSDSAQYFKFKAQYLGDTTRNFAEYINLIDYRLAVGEVIGFKEFKSKFPTGWTND